MRYHRRNPYLANRTGQLRRGTLSGASLGADDFYIGVGVDPTSGAVGVGMDDGVMMIPTDDTTSTPSSSSSSSAADIAAGAKVAGDILKNIFGLGTTPAPAKPGPAAPTGGAVQDPDTGSGAGGMVNSGTGYNTNSLLALQQMQAQQAALAAQRAAAAARASASQPTDIKKFIIPGLIGVAVIGLLLAMKKK